MQKLRGITVDNGGSEIRVLPDDTTCNIYKWRNDVVQIEEKNFRPKDVESPECVVRIVNATDRSFCGLYASGATGHAYDGKELRISSQETKTGSDNFYKEFIYAVALDSYNARIKDLANGIQRCGAKGNRDSKDTVYDYAIVACIPIKEFNGIEDCPRILKSRIAGDYEVEFPLVSGSPVIRFNISEERTGVVAEGGVTMTALKGAVGEDDISLIVDMGHITTDIAIFEGKNLKGKVASPGYAGSTLAGNIRAHLAEMGIVVSDDKIQRVLETGKARKGATEIDVSDVIAEEADMFVKNYLKMEVIGVLNRNALDATQVQNFIPLGAPMTPDSNGRNVIQEAIIRECRLSDARVQLLEEDLRYVNIRSAARFTRKLVNMFRSKYAEVV